MLPARIAVADEIAVLTPVVLAARPLVGTLVINEVIP
jgi:hypothetical protein